MATSPRALPTNKRNSNLTITVTTTNAVNTNSRSHQQKSAFMPLRCASAATPFLAPTVHRLSTGERPAATSPSSSADVVAGSIDHNPGKENHLREENLQCHPQLQCQQQQLRESHGTTAAFSSLHISPAPLCQRNLFCSPSAKERKSDAPPSSHKKRKYPSTSAISPRPVTAPPRSERVEHPTRAASAPARLFTDADDAVPEAVLDRRSPQPYKYKLTSTRTNGAMREISPDTAAALISGQHPDLYKQIIIIDCRYHYEYLGGHIKGALNFNDPQEVIEFFFSEKPYGGGPDTCVIFYCEFSQKRAPKMCQFLRSYDRELQGIENFPHVDYPEVYLITSGYKEFYKRYPALCSPQTYAPMLDKRFRDEFRACVVQERQSWQRQSRKPR